MNEMDTSAAIGTSTIPNHQPKFNKHAKYGRTWRHRKKCKHTAAPAYAVDCFPVLVKLCQWLQRHYSSKCPRTKLKPAVFAETGRGLMTLSGLKAGETVVRIPRDAMISCSDVLNDKQIGNILRSSDVKLRAMDILSIFLIFQKCLGEDSEWKPYIDSLPSEYSVPIFSSEREMEVMPTFLKSIIQKQKEDVSLCFERTDQIFQKVAHIHGSTSPSLLDVRWAWFTVNTRAVYLKTNHPDPVLADEDVYALAPYLDLLNHSHSAQVETGLNTKSGCYEIVTLVPYSAHEQVFINYGPHDNIKLYSEYGFILPNNPHNKVPVSLKELIIAVKDFDVQQAKDRKDMLYEKEKIVVSNRSGDNLGISREGPCWNCEVVVTILLMTPEELHRWQVVYHDLDGVCHREIVLQCLRSLCQRKLESFKLVLVGMEGIGECTEAFMCGKQLVKDCCEDLLSALKF